MLSWIQSKTVPSCYYSFHLLHALLNKRCRRKNYLRILQNVLMHPYSDLGQKQFLFCLVTRLRTINSVSPPWPAYYVYVTGKPGIMFMYILELVISRSLQNSWLATASFVALCWFINDKLNFKSEHLEEYLLMKAKSLKVSWCYGPRVHLLIKEMTMMGIGRYLLYDKYSGVKKTALMIFCNNSSSFPGLIFLNFELIENSDAT